MKEKGTCPFSWQVTSECFGVVFFSLICSGYENNGNKFLRKVSLQARYGTMESIEKQKEKFPKHIHNIYHLHSKPLWIINKQINLLRLV